MSTAQPKCEKCIYLKKRLLSQDELWKLIIPLILSKPLPCVVEILEKYFGNK